MKNHYGLSLRLLITLVLIRKQYRELLKMENYLLFKLVAVFGYKKTMFLYMWTTTKVIIWSAWSQCNLHKEKAHATL